MSKVLCIPDPHLKIEVIKKGIEVADKMGADKIVMLGDYFDDWHSINIDYWEMMDYLKKLLRTDHRVIALLGNHELSYMGYPCSGYKPELQEYMNEKLVPDHRFYLCAAIDGILYSHAGFCTKWLKGNKLITENDFRIRLTKSYGAELIEKKMENIDKFDVFAQVGPGRGGHSLPSPLWADASELLEDSIPNVKQVVGHTPVREITYANGIWFTDTYSNYNKNSEYLLVTKGHPEIIDYEDLAYGR